MNAIELSKNQHAEARKLFNQIEKAEEAVEEEQLAVKRLIADLLEMSPDDAQFDAKVAVLKEQVEHHVEEEEASCSPR